MPTRPRLTSTHTVATLEVSPKVYDEIATKLRDAEYHHVFEDDKPGAMIDMGGIGLTRVPTLICKSCTREYSLATPHKCPGIQGGKPTDISSLARWLEAMHDSAREDDQPYLAHAAELLRAIQLLAGRVSYVTHEKKARGNYAMTVGFLDLQSVQEAHQMIAAASTKAGKS